MVNVFKKYQYVVPVASALTLVKLNNMHYFFYFYLFYTFLPSKVHDIRISFMKYIIYIYVATYILYNSITMCCCCHYFPLFFSFSLLFSLFSFMLHRHGCRLLLFLKDKKSVFN